MKPIFKTWRTIKLGTGLKTPDDFRRALDQAGCEKGEWGHYLLGRPEFVASVAKKPTELELVLVSGADLGLEDEEPYEMDIYNRAEESGLKLVPAEVGPQLCLQSADQPADQLPNSGCSIGMESISDHVEGNDKIFYVGLVGGRPWLDAHSHAYEDEEGEDDRDSDDDGHISIFTVVVRTSKDTLFVFGK